MGFQGQAQAAPLPLQDPNAQAGPPQPPFAGLNPGAPQDPNAQQPVGPQGMTPEDLQNIQMFIQLAQKLGLVGDPASQGFMEHPGIMPGGHDQQQQH